MTQELIRKSLIGIGLAVSMQLSAADDLGLMYDIEEVPTPVEVLEKLQALELKESKSEKEVITDKNTEALTSEDAVNLDFVVNMGKKVWSVVEAGQPVLSEGHDYASALPQGIAKSSELRGFSSLEYKSYRLISENYFGMHVVDVVLTVAHRFGGNYKGEGQYLSDVTVIPSDINVLWGYTLDVGVDNIRVANIGKQDAPVAGLSLETAIKVSTVFQKSVTRRLIDFRGDSPQARIIR